MRALLMFPDRDFDSKLEQNSNIKDLIQDLEMETILSAMAKGDDLVFKVSSAVILGSSSNDENTIRWRQEILKDCLSHEDSIRRLYEITSEPIKIRKSMFLISAGQHPSLMLSDGRRILEALNGVLGKLYSFALKEKDNFKSEGLKNFCAMLIDQLAPEYLSEMKKHLSALHFENGILFSAKLGIGNTGKDFITRFFVPERWAWLKDLIKDTPPHYRFSIDPRDESGAREVSELRDEVLKDIAVSVMQASKHVEAFFNMLRTELAFYIGCLNLNNTLHDKNCPVFMPEISSISCTLRFKDLRDVALSLSLQTPAIGNDLDITATPVVLITGANQGGKSTFLRSVGSAHMMFQAGMFVAARQYEADLRDGVFTHYRRREDKDLNSGKFDEELYRMDEIISQVQKAPLVLFNESFAATNEREGSEVARQIIMGLAQANGHVIFVTHMYALAESFINQSTVRTYFLRADRDDSGQRSFKILSGKPELTSFGKDLYNKIFLEKSSADNV